jgi:hypothetical protein
MNITATLNAKLQPFHRHELEGALDDIFNKENLKVKITGGGTGQEKNGEISFCDIEIAVEDFTDNKIERIIEIFEIILAPVGSKLTIFPKNENDEIKVIHFGKHEGLGIYLSNDLDDQIYETCDVNVIFDEIEKILNENKLGRIESYWEGEETSLYLYGKSFTEIQNAIKPFIEKYPLCQKCRIVKIA